MGAIVRHWAFGVDSPANGVGVEGSEVSVQGQGQSPGQGLRDDGSAASLQVPGRSPGQGLEAVRARARELLFDYLAVTRRGAASAPAAAAQTLVEDDGPAIVDGSDRRAATTTAALVNGIAAHALELDDTHEAASLHPGVAVWPAVLALADERGASLGQAIDAAIAGYDVVCALGERLDPGEAYARGFHPTGVCGAVGAAVAAAHMLGLDHERRVHAIGIAASAASGLVEFLRDGTWTKPFHAGQAASSGIVAARLAAGGYTGPATAIEGPQGFLRAFGGRGDTSVPLALPSPGTGMLATAVKLYPCCRYIHGSLDLLLELVADGGLRAEDVAFVSCGVLSGGWSLVGDPIADKRRVATTTDAQFSMPFAAALALTSGEATLEGFAGAAELAPGLAPLMDRVECHRIEPVDTAAPAAWGAEVVVHTTDGTVIARERGHIKGSPAQPVSHAELLGKASGLIGADAASRLLEACLDLADDEPVARLGRATP
jgi:2-methylcitrate dehydratase PrpD